MVDRWYEAAFGGHYPLLYAHRDEAEARRCLELLPELAPLTGRDDQGTLLPVLDLGCGDGRHLSHLQAQGVATVGLDLSANLLARASRRRDASSAWGLVRGDMQFLPFKADRFASVLSLFTAFGYFGSLTDNEGVIGEVARVLAEGGHWFLDYFDCDAVTAELGSGQTLERKRRLGPLIVVENRRLADGRDRVCKDVNLQPVPGQEQEAAALGIGTQGLEYTETVALFDLGDLDRLALGRGLRRVAQAGSYRGDALGQGDRWLVVYRSEGHLDHEGRA